MQVISQEQLSSWKVQHQSPERGDHVGAEEVKATDSGETVSGSNSLLRMILQGNRTTNNITNTLLASQDGDCIACSV